VVAAAATAAAAAAVAAAAAAEVHGAEDARLRCVRRRMLDRRWQRPARQRMQGLRRLG